MNRTGVAQLVKSESSLTPVQGLLQRKCVCGNHTPGGGECAECALKKKNLQRKLTIGASNDPLEQEADRVAEQVMSTSSTSTLTVTPPRIQRFSEQAKEGSVSAPASVDRVLASSGRPLEPALKHDMSQRFGHDFSHVRVHTGRAAEQSARDVNANAYTVGNNIVFGAGRFEPGSHKGQRLLAHELTHVVQQSDSDNVHVGQNNENRALSSNSTSRQLESPTIQRTKGNQRVVARETTGGRTRIQCINANLANAGIPWAIIGLLGSICAVIGGIAGLAGGPAAPATVPSGMATAVALCVSAVSGLSFGMVLGIITRCCQDPSVEWVFAQNESKAGADTGKKTA